eukprot:UN07062
MGQGAGYNTSACVGSMLNASMSFVCGLGADSFVAPDMSIYETIIEKEVVIEYEECDDCDAAGNIVLGIGIASTVFVIIGCFLYCFVIKPKLGVVELSQVIDHDRVPVFIDHGSSEGTTIVKLKA